MTGDLYSYGLIETGTKSTTTNGLTATNQTVSVTNSEGTSEAYICSSITFTAAAGIVGKNDGRLAGYVNLNKLTGVGRYDFEKDEDGNYYVIIDDEAVYVWDGVQVYIDETDAWTTLDKARSYSDNLTVYYDKDPGEGGKIRVVIAY